ILIGGQAISRRDIPGAYSIFVPRTLRRPLRRIRRCWPLWWRTLRDLAQAGGAASRRYKLGQQAADEVGEEEARIQRLIVAVAAGDGVDALLGVILFCAEDDECRVRSLRGLADIVICRTIA